MTPLLGTGYKQGEKFYAGEKGEGGGSWLLVVVVVLVGCCYG